jgi:hypothetical protein
MRTPDNLRQRVALRLPKRSVTGLRISILLTASVIAVIGQVTTTSARDTQATRQFSWPGIYDLVGTGFPEGERKAVMSITRNDTAYTLESLQGPPGQLRSFKITDDSAHVIWDLGPDQMFVDLRGIGDSLMGEWSTGEGAGLIVGARRATSQKTGLQD